MDSRLSHPLRVLSVSLTLHLACSLLDEVGVADEPPAAAPAPAVERPEPPPPDLHASTLSELLRRISEHYGTADRCSREPGIPETVPACRLWAVQQTLTTSGGVDGALGGAFEIPYFWHWVEPNPRLGIVHLPDEQPLAALPPLEGYGRYQTFGHMDRDPTLYLGDLASETPGYRHDRAGTFYTFGWCSEREMALCTLLELWGYEVKIVQEGIHVTTRVWLQTEPPTEMVLDTTFNLAYFQDLEDGKTLSSWNEDLGEGTEIERYNGTCHSASELRQVGAIPVSSAAQDRLIGMAREWFEGGV